MRTTYLTCLVLIEYDEKLFYALFSNFSVGTINSVVIGTFPLSLIILTLIFEYDCVLGIVEIYHVESYETGI